MSDPCATSSFSWVSALAPLGSFILGFVTAVFAEPARQKIFKPKLALTFMNDTDHVAWTPHRGNGEENEAYYIRVGVKNISRRLAKQCRAYLVNIEKKEKTGFERTIYADSIQLAWSCRVKGTELDGIDLPHGVVQYFDLLATTDKGNSYCPQIKPFPYRYEELISEENKVLRFTVQVSGDGLDPALIKIVFSWKGQWNKFDVYKEE